MADILDVEVFNSQYTAQQIEAMLSSGLVRINGRNNHWEQFDIATGAWFDTGKIAVGTNGEHSITYDPMSLTDAQKQIARGNIGAINGNVVANGFNQLLPISSASGEDSGITITNNEDGSYKINGTATNTAVNVWLLGTYNNTNAIIPTIINHKYYVKNIRAYNYHTLVLGDRYNTERIEICLISGITSVRIGNVNVGDAFNDYVVKPMIIDLTAIFGAGNEPTTVEQFRSSMFSDDYYPFTPILNHEEQNAYMLAFDSFISPEINGVRNYWDGTNYHRRIARVDLGSLTWLYNNEVGHLYYRTAGLASSIKTDGKVYCIGYTQSTYNKVYENVSDKLIGIRASDGALAISNYAYTSASAFKQAMSGVFLYYELATEQVLNIDANGLRYELLWENASPTSAFAEQTVSLDLSKYKFVMIELRNSTTSSRSINQIIKTSADSVIYFISSGGTIHGRNISDYSNIQIADCGQGNEFCIPTKIYGIR